MGQQSLTGEIDLNGTVYAIGGLDAKIEGAINAGITKILCPEANKEDVKIIRKKENSPITNNVDIVFIKDLRATLEKQFFGSSGKDFPLSEFVPFTRQAYNMQVNNWLTRKIDNFDF